jgi:hypothetical protein
MQKFTEDRTCRANRELPLPRFCGWYGKNLWVLLLAGTITLAACGGRSGSGSSSQNAAPLSGNWQFTVANPPDQSFLGGLQGGFLLQTNGSVTGAAVYTISLPGQNGGNPTVCNSGTAPITATISGQSVTLTAVAATQTFTFTGMLSADGSTMTGTYASTAGTAVGGAACGTAQTGLQWSATSVPSLSGVFQGSFHSTGGSAGLANQDFPVSVVLTQGQNIGASNATVTGTLNFVPAANTPSDYPCLASASVNGQVSGNSVILQIIGTSGLDLGQIGGSAGSGLGAVTFNSTQLGYVLQSTVGTAYAVNSSACPGVSLSNAGDSGNICLALSSTNACQQPITLSPAVLVFPTQLLGSTPTSQTITLTNTSPSGATLNGLQLQWSVNDGAFDAPSDFNGLANFTEQSTCAPVGSTFSLGSAKSCSITVFFAPQQSCPWLPFGTPPSLLGAAPDLCPFPLGATLTVSSPASADNDTSFAVPITGTGSSAITGSTPELNFGSEAVSEASLPQLLSFTNHSPNPVQILGRAACVNNPPTSGHNTLPHPLQDTSPVAGLQVVANGPGSVGGNISPDVSTITYSCDSDPKTLLPNFQISSDTCTGSLLASQGTCSLEVAYAPQPNTSVNSGLAYFLELNTLQCSSSDNVTSDCEIDSGRFPVELTANPPSPLRMSPGAGLNFGSQPKGLSSAPQTITLFNDPNDPNAGTVNFVSKVVVSGNYSETDDCPYSLAPGGICTLTVTFDPAGVGFEPGTLTINVTPEPTGSPQIVQLLGTGQ